MSLSIVGLITTLLILSSSSTAWVIHQPQDVSNLTEDELVAFLNADLTNEREYTSYFTCGHFARELARNATAYNITLGGAIVSPDNNFMDYDNHLMNYVYINGTLIFIEPQNDQYYPRDGLWYPYHKLYPNGKYTPSRW